jgi:histidine triad (HIT) family protein
MCVFCKIVNGEIPSYKVYEDDLIIGILDVSQATIGHTLVIPKTHYDNIFALDEITAGKIFERVTKVANKIKKNLEVNDLNLLNNNGPLAGQTVNHYHVHLLPRYKGDNLKFDFVSNKLSKEDFTVLMNKISK